MSEQIAVIGAGMVGVSCALELQRRGFGVTLMDRKAPGQETSYGNAGIMPPSSLVPFNNPGLWADLPRLLRNRSAHLRYDPMFLARNVAWVCHFLASTRRAVYEQTVPALHALLQLSIGEHRRLLADAGVLGRLRETGWLILYRNRRAFEGSQALRQTLAHYGVEAPVLDAGEVAELEPGLAPIFSHGMWTKGAVSVDSPGRVVQAYADLFAARGGRIERRVVRSLQRGDGGAWLMRDADGAPSSARRVVVALGPWAPELLASLGLRVPMAWERGYHMHYAAPADKPLQRPIYDTGGAYVLSPMQDGMRLTTGVELAERDAAPNLAQLEMAEKSAREACALGPRLDDQPWMGRRPTLPDSRPMVGEAPGHPGLWLAFGHQHIGFTTGPGTAALLGALMCGDATPIDPVAFAPGRYLGLVQK